MGGGGLQGRYRCTIAGPQLRTGTLSELPIALQWIRVPRTQAWEETVKHKFTRMAPSPAILWAQNGPPDGCGTHQWCNTITSMAKVPEINIKSFRSYEDSAKTFISMIYLWKKTCPPRGSACAALKENVISSFLMKGLVSTNSILPLLNENTRKQLMKLNYWRISFSFNSISRSAGAEHNCLLLSHNRLILFIITPANVKHLFSKLIDRRNNSGLY